MRWRLLLLWAVGIATAALYLLARPAMPWPVSCTVKTIPILCMALALLLSRRDTFALLVVGGLLLSAVGDFLLAMPGDGTFVPGLVAFLLGHVAYVGAFLTERRGLHLLHALPVLAYGVGVGLWLWPHLGGMSLPVLAYLVVICTMLWRAAARVGRGATLDLWLGLAGAVLFVLSDTAVAANRFVTELPAASAVIMLTYWPGQLGLALAAGLRRR